MLADVQRERDALLASTAQLHEQLKKSVSEATEARKQAMSLGKENESLKQQVQERAKLGTETSKERKRLISQLEEITADRDKLSEALRMARVRLHETSTELHSVRAERDELVRVRVRLRVRGLHSPLRRGAASRAGAEHERCAWRRRRDSRREPHSLAGGWRCAPQRVCRAPAHGAVA
jgi:flagellar biosynthesis chaperone FliJ